MKLKLKLKGKEYDIELWEAGDVLKVRIGEKDFIFEEKEVREKDVLVAQSSLPKRDFSKKEVVAPITGTISEIFVKEGDFIKKDQKIILLSSMKMENEIVSEFEGKVKKILVEKNQKVKGGDPLIILE